MMAWQAAAKINSEVEIAGLKFKNALMNGAYINSKTLEDVEALAGSRVGAVVVGSISVEPRRQNRGQVYWKHKESLFSLNSYGLPNGGLPYFKTKLPQMVELCHERGKPLIANLIGFSEADFVTLVKLAEVSGADMAELNFGCPNVWDEGYQKRIVSYHAELVKATLVAIAEARPKIKLSVKISPLPPDILRDVSHEIAASEIIQVVTATNTYPNAAVTSGARSSENAEADDIFAGLGGRALKPISLGVVKQLRAWLPSEISIIGCGGISTALDVSDYLAAGAKAVQVASALKHEGYSVFEKILFQAGDRGEY